MDIDGTTRRTRVEKLRELVQEYNGQAALCRAINKGLSEGETELSASQINSALKSLNPPNPGKKPTRGFGHNICRKIERALNKPPFWFDCDDIEAELLGLFKRMDNEHKQSLILTARSYANESHQLDAGVISVTTTKKVIA